MDKTSSKLGTEILNGVSVVTPHVKALAKKVKTMDKIAAFPVGKQPVRSAKRIKQLIEAQNAGSRASLSKSGKAVKGKIVAQNKAAKTNLDKTANLRALFSGAKAGLGRIAGRFGAGGTRATIHKPMQQIATAPGQMLTVAGGGAQRGLANVGGGAAGGFNRNKAILGGLMGGSAIGGIGLGAAAANRRNNRRQ